MNKIFLSGRITRDITLNVTQNGNEIVNNCIAVENGKDAQGNRLTTFVNFSAYGQQARFLESYAQKGSLVLIEGRINVSTYEKNGQTVVNTSVIAERTELMSGSKTANEPKQEQQPQQPKAKPYNPTVDDEDLPF